MYVHNYMYTEWETVGGEIYHPSEPPHQGESRAAY